MDNYYVMNILLFVAETANIKLLLNSDTITIQFLNSV